MLYKLFKNLLKKFRGYLTRPESLEWDNSRKKYCTYYKCAISGKLKTNCWTQKENGRWVISMVVTEA